MYRFFWHAFTHNAPKPRVSANGMWCYQGLAVGSLYIVLIACALYVLQHDKAVYFCPTPLAASLCGGYVPGTPGTMQTSGGYIIVETNFRVRSREGGEG